MNANLKEKVFQYCIPEVVGFTGVADRLRDCLLIYKLLLNIENYGDSEVPFIFKWSSNDEVIPEELTNAFVVGYKPIMEEKDEYITAFINNSISGSSDEEKGFEVYLDTERKIVQFTRNIEDGAHFGRYSLFNGNVEQLLCAIIERLIPWYIVSTPEIRKEFPALFLNGTLSDVENKLEELVREKNILEDINGKELETLGKKLFERKIIEQNNVITDHELRIKRCYKEIALSSTTIREARAFLEAYKNQQLEYESPIKEIIDFCKSNDDISIVDIDAADKKVKFEIKSILCNTDMDDYYAIVSNESASIFRYLSGYSKEDVKMALNAIFVDKTVKTHVGTGLTLNIWDGHVSSYTPNFVDNYTMPHPHLDSSLTCLGSTATDLIMQYTTQLRFYEAINQLMFSATQFSLADSYVAEKWARYIDDYEAIELPNGERVNFAGLVDYLKEEGNVDG